MTGVEPRARGLIDAARRAMAFAYAPYSGFAVGAAVLLDDGTIVSGSNLENASFGLSICAEAAALTAANGVGQFGSIVAIAVAGAALSPLAGERFGGGGALPIRPCGRCRQLLSEAALYGDRDITVWCASGDGSAVEQHLASDLLPLAFGPATAGRAERASQAAEFT